jgi:hypothetical protein
LFQETGSGVLSVRKSQRVKSKEKHGVHILPFAGANYKLLYTFTMGIGQPYAKVDLIPLPESTLSPSQGLKIWPQSVTCFFREKIGGRVMAFFTQPGWPYDGVFIYYEKQLMLYCTIFTHGGKALGYGVLGYDVHS